MSPRGDVSKLPKWAQAEISRLESNVEHWKDRALSGPTDSDTFAHPAGDDRNPGGKPLGRGTRVRFWTQKGSVDGQPGHYIDVRLADAIGGGRALEINSGSHSIHVIPQSSNAAKIVPGDWV